VVLSPCDRLCTERLRCLLRLDVDYLRGGKPERLNAGSFGERVQISVRRIAQVLKRHQSKVSIGLMVADLKAFRRRRYNSRFMRKPLLFGFAIVALVLSVRWWCGRDRSVRGSSVRRIRTDIHFLGHIEPHFRPHGDARVHAVPRRRQALRGAAEQSGRLAHQDQAGGGRPHPEFPAGFFLVLFSYEVLNHSLEAWFRKPADNEVQLFVEASVLLQRDFQDKVNTQAALLAAQPETRQLLADGVRTPGFLPRFSKAQGLVSAAILPASATCRWTPRGRTPPGPTASPSWPAGRWRRAADHRLCGAGCAAPAGRGAANGGHRKYNQQWSAIRQVSKNFKLFYVMLMAVITLFVLFVATWIALFLSSRSAFPSPRCWMPPAKCAAAT